MPIETFALSNDKIDALKERHEGHYFDFKSKTIKPSKISQTICAFANADGGEIYIGIEDPKHGWIWDGFESIENANSHIDLFERLFPLGGDFLYDFITHPKESGFVLRVEVKKSARIFKASDENIYLRRGAQNLRLTDPDSIERLKRQKGIVSFEDEVLNIDIDIVDNSIIMIEFMLNVIPDADPTSWLKKQVLINDNRPTVAAIVLFSEEPQSYLPNAGIKIYRYKTTDPEGSRETLDFDPITIEGCAYNEIFEAVNKVKQIVDTIPVVGSLGLEAINYPPVAIHEIITNAVLHRDYSLNDATHVRIFDNRIEIESPGRLPAHITPANILTERAIRNQKINRYLNKFKNPPNKDVGEGLNTSFRAMRDLKLRAPDIEERGNSVLVTLKHEELGSPDEIILSYLEDHYEITNSKAREICHVPDTAKMTKIIQRMLKAGVIEKIEGRAKSNAGYRKKIFREYFSEDPTLPAQPPGGP